MSGYRYRAARSDGGTVSGLIEAPTAGQASAVLSERGLFPLNLDLASDEASRRRAASRRELAIVFQSLASLVGAGVPIERAVAASESVARGALRDTLIQARRALREGQGLARALEEQGRGTVPPVVLGILRAGERNSRLGAALAQAAVQLEHEAELRARLQQALAYPILLSVAGTASVLFISTVVVPRFARILGDLGQALPPSARLLIALSALLSRYGLLVAVGLAAAIAAVVQWYRRPDGRLAAHEALLRLPLVGPIRHAIATARVCRALGATLESGLPILPALGAAREAAGDDAVARRLTAAGERIAQGAPLTESLEREAAVWPTALQLLAVGEQSGRLAPMAHKAGDLAAQESERALKSVVALLEPGIILVFGGLVAFVAAALLQAVYSIRPGGM